VFVGFTPGKSYAITIGVLYPRVQAAAYSPVANVGLGQAVHLA
jgi:hypothetical protein